jgi:hypothetical protein
MQEIARPSHDFSNKKIKLAAAAEEQKKEKIKPVAAEKQNI